MNKEEILKAFSELGPEDQEAIRAELSGHEPPGGEGETQGPMAMCQQIMEKIQGGGDPMEICKGMMEKMKEKCCP